MTIKKISLLIKKNELRGDENEDRIQIILYPSPFAFLIFIYWSSFYSALVEFNSDKGDKPVMKYEQPGSHQLNLQTKL